LPTVGVPILERLSRRFDRLDDGVGVDQSIVGASVGRQVKVLAQQPQPQVASELTGLVKHRTGQLAVVRPRPAIEVVAAHAGPGVVDDTDLRVHVNRCALMVLDVEDVHPVRAGASARLDRLLAADLVGRQREPAVDVGVARHHRDEVELRIVRQRAREKAGHPLRP
jgi:hypothetical protein